MKKLLMFLCFIATSLIITNASFATPIQWKSTDGGNGHWYEVIFQTTNWLNAKQLAEQRLYDSIQGHLATITSQEEQTWLWENLPYNKVWLGGYQADNNPEPDKGWAWVTGEKWDYAFWRPGEPNDNLGHEDYLIIDQLIIPGQWNDVRLDGWNKMTGYVVEHDSASAPVPEPATMLLLGSGLAGLFGFRKKFRKK